MSKTRAAIYRRNIERVPLHQFLGVKIETIEEGESLVSIPLGVNTLNPAGSLHGGVIYLVSDVAAFAAIGPVLGEEEFAVTIDIQTSVYRGAAGERVFFKGRVASRGRRLAFMNVEVTDETGRLLAETRVTKAILNSVPDDFKR